jgi:hypothetical protein
MKGLPSPTGVLFFNLVHAITVWSHANPPSPAHGSPKPRPPRKNAPKKIPSILKILFILSKKASFPFLISSDTQFQLALCINKRKNSFNVGTVSGKRPLRHIKSSVTR